MNNQIFRKKSIASLLQGASQGNTLKKELGSFDLTMLGVGAIIGTGIFVLTGKGALTAGPGLFLSFIIAGFACLFSALAYAEFASTVPVSGSVYTFTYATLGEFLAWIIGWDLILEYLLAVSAVSAGWSGYFQSFLQGFGLELPVVLRAASGTIEGQTTYFNLPAFVIIMIITTLLSIGVKQTKLVNNIMVVIKVFVVLLFIFVGYKYVQPDNWQPLLPFGMKGVFSTAALVFFAFIGFDAVASAAEETRNPKKDLPRGIIFSLLICTILYVIVSLIMTGIVPYNLFAGNVDHPISLAIKMTGNDWISGVIDLGAILGMTTVMLVMLYGQTRVIFAMSRDGLMPKIFSKVHPKLGTPIQSTWIFGTLAALLGGFVSLDKLAELVNIGTLTAFILISIAVIVLRQTQPDLPRAFRCPAVPLVPILAVLFCGFLITQLSAGTWLRFIVWLLVGIVIYFTYSRHHSSLNKENQ